VFENKADFDIDYVNKMPILASLLILITIAWLSLVF